MSWLASRRLPKTHFLMAWLNFKGTSAAVEMKLLHKLGFPKDMKVEVKVVCKFCGVASSKRSIKSSIKPRERSERGKKTTLFFYRFRHLLAKTVGIVGFFKKK